MNILILGGDGFCGWPTALHLSAQGHAVIIADNLSRRAIDNELEAQSLTPIQPMGTRIGVWRELTETHRLIDLAHMISDVTHVPIQHGPNPRREADSNDLAACNEGLVGLGLKPTTLRQGLMEEVADIAKQYAHRCDRSRIPCESHWTADIADTTEAADASTAG